MISRGTRGKWKVTEGREGERNSARFFCARKGGGEKGAKKSIGENKHYAAVLLGGEKSKKKAGGEEIFAHLAKGNEVLVYGKTMGSAGI